MAETTPTDKSTCAAWRRGFALLALGLAGCGGSVADGKPRNVVLISIDTLRPDHLGAYGYARATSPTLDKLAAAGVRFDDVTAAAPWTLPSHATMLTGLYPNHHGVKSHEQRLSGNVVTLAEEFRDNGFDTLAVVNTHNIGAKQFQLDQGFGEFRYIIETEDDPKTLKLRTFNSGETIVSTAKELLRERDEDKPFFLFLHFYDVHTDFTPKAEYRQQFVGPYTGRLTGSTKQLVDLREQDHGLGEADIRWLNEMYDAEIRQLDDLLGRFFAWMDDQGMEDDTLFVITSDHGEEFQEHGNLLHGRTQYQEVLRIPLLIKGPGVPGGVGISTPVGGADITPTILGVMGLPSRQARDGLDLSPLWQGGTLPERLFFSDSDHNNRINRQPVYDIKKMVREGSQKLLYDTSSGETELFDLRVDGGERNDLSKQQPERVEALRKALDGFLEGAVTPETVPPPTAEEREKLEALGYDGGSDN